MALKLATGSFISRLVLHFMQYASIDYLFRVSAKTAFVRPKQSPIVMGIASSNRRLRPGARNDEELQIFILVVFFQMLHHITDFL